jgi:hypothetical protein
MRRTHHRGGASLVVVLALLVVCSSIVLQLVSASLRQRLQLRRDLQKQQTQWLLRAGAGFAAQMLRESDSGLPDLPEVLVVEIPHFDSARLRFSLQADNSATSAVSITAQVGDPDRPVQLTSCSAKYKIDLPTAEKASGEEK